MEAEAARGRLAELPWALAAFGEQTLGKRQVDQIVGEAAAPQFAHHLGDKGLAALKRRLQPIGLCEDLAYESLNGPIEKDGERRDRPGLRDDEPAILRARSRRSARVGTSRLSITVGCRRGRCRCRCERVVERAAF